MQTMMELKTYSCHNHTEANAVAQRIITDLSCKAEHRFCVSRTCITGFISLRGNKRISIFCNRRKQFGQVEFTFSSIQILTIVKMSSTLNLERTVALIKPHAVRHRFSIVRRIQMSGFHILQVWKIEIIDRSTVRLIRDFGFPRSAM